ncbi:hypothetical protein DFP72DRAFT_768525, partial [Ephemerocybe angulata]
TLLAFSVAISSARAIIRFGCSQLVTERYPYAYWHTSISRRPRLICSLTSLVTTGIMLPHVHQIIGG